MVCEECPCSSALFDWLDIVVDPAIGQGATLIGHLKLPEESTDAVHVCCMNEWQETEFVGEVSKA